VVILEGPHKINFARQILVSTTYSKIDQNASSSFRNEICGRTDKIQYANNFISFIPKLLNYATLLIACIRRLYSMNALHSPDRTWKYTWFPLRLF
jgi:hypothetical protein